MDDLTFRKATEADSDFAYGVKRTAFRKYADRVWGWDEARQRGLHETRFAAQNFEIIGFRGNDVGVLSTVEEADCVHVYQLFILPGHQGRGIGSACMKRVMGDARISRKQIRLQVLKVNSRATEFYQRLGFRNLGETDTHTQMVWSTG
jgi:GNAT superfamily N-acetyltransferase